MRLPRKKKRKSNRKLKWISFWINVGGCESSRPFQYRRDSGRNFVFDYLPDGTVTEAEAGEHEYKW